MGAPSISNPATVPPSQSVQPGTNTPLLVPPGTAYPGNFATFATDASGNVTGFNSLNTTQVMSSINQNSVQKLQLLLWTMNLAVPNTLTTPPTISEGSASASPAIATVRIIPWNGNTPQTNDVSNSPYIKLFNASKLTGSWVSKTQVTMNSQEKFQMLTPVFPTNAGGLGMMCISFIFDGSDIEILHYGALNFFGTVNGQSIASAGTTTGTASVSSWTRFAFGTRSPRNITLWLIGSIGSIAIGANDTITPMNHSLDVSAVLHGDSYFTTSGTRMPGIGPGAEAALRAGIPNMWGTGWGGGGYYMSGASANSLTAFPDLANVESCDLWHCSLGINETRAGVGAALFDSTVLQYYTQVRNAFPLAVISATGPWSPSESAAITTSRTDISDSVLAQLNKISGPWVFNDNLRGTWANSSGKTGTLKVASTSSTTSINGGPSVNTGSQTPSQAGTWQTGNGYAGATTGSGNGDLYVSSDGTHPTPTGVDYLGTMIARGWRDSILSL